MVVEGGGYEIKMPGSLSNEDEGQDDMDFEDDMPGEVKVGEEGEAGCPSRRYFYFYFFIFFALPPLPFPSRSPRAATAALYAGWGVWGKGLVPRVPAASAEGWMDGSGSAQSRHYCDV